MLIVLLTISTAWPCAALVHRGGDLAESPGAEVLLTAHADGTSTATWRVAYEGDAAEFGWIVPIPGPFLDIADSSEDTFVELREQTAIAILEDYGERDTGGAGCACFGAGSAKGGVNGTLRGDDELVIAEGFTGTYDFTVVDAGSPDLDAWLDDNGWELGAASEDLDHYAALDHPVLLLRVSPDAPVTPEGGSSLPPVAITWDSDTLMFPSVMALHADAPEQRTTVWVHGDTGRAEVSGWSVGEVGGTLPGSLDDDAEALWLDALREVGEDQAWYLSWAGERDEGFLTRFDTLAPREVHTTDAVFSFTDDTDTASVLIRLSDDEAGAAWLGGVVPLLALLVGARARRRRRG